MKKLVILGCLMQATLMMSTFMYGQYDWRRVNVQFKNALDKPVYLKVQSYEYNDTCQVPATDKYTLTISSGKQSKPLEVCAKHDPNERDLRLPPVKLSFDSTFPSRKTFSVDRFKMIPQGDKPGATYQITIKKRTSHRFSPGPKMEENW